MENDISKLMSFCTQSWSGCWAVGQLFDGDPGKKWGPLGVWSYIEVIQRFQVLNSATEVSGFKLCNQYKHLWQQMRSKVAKIKIVLLFECFYLEHFAVYLCSIHWAWVTLTKTSRAHLFPHYWISRISKQCLAITVSKIEKLKGEDLLLVIK